MSSEPDPHGTAVLEAARRQPRVSVVIPCLNEAETIRIVVEKAWQGLNAAGVAGEVVVADNGSTDGSRELAADAGARVVPVAARGYGSALTGGIEAAHGEFVIMGDADDTYDFSRITAFVEALERGDDLVMGNRFAGGIAPGAMPWKNRLVGNPVLTFVGRVLFRSPVRDFHCGLRAFRRDAILGLGLASPGMEFASEMVIRASLAGLRVSEVPTTLSSGPAGREPHLRPWRDGWRHLRLLLLYSPRWLFLYPGIAFGLAGAAVMLALVPGAITIGGTRFDVHTMLYGGAALMVGYQTVLFAVFARIFGMTQGFLPESRRMRGLLRVITLETGIAVGLVLVALGLAGSIWAVVHWSNRSFGTLDYANTLRIVIPSVVALVLGVQTIVSSFFLSFLGLADRGAR